MSHHGKKQTAPTPWPAPSPVSGATPWPSPSPVSGATPWPNPSPVSVATPTPPVPAFQILTVCTGNICRSPMAEIMLRHALRDIPGIGLASAGTNALVGHPMPPEARAVLEGLSLTDEPPHVAQQLTTDLVQRSDLILALTREHRRRVVQLDPSATRRVFTLREFAYVAGHVTEADLAEAAADLAWRDEVEGLPPTPQHPGRAAVGAVFAVNGVFPWPDPTELDVADPFGQPLVAYAEAAARMLPAVEALAEFFAHLPGLGSPASPSGVTASWGQQSPSTSSEALVGLSSR